jgi:hypothetical protein
MDTAPIRIHLFKVDESHAAITLEAMIDRANADDIESRIRRVGFGEVRLDLVEKRRDRNTGDRLWYLDLTKLRDTFGPGKAARDRVVEDLDLSADEVFGEETAGLYLPDQRWLLLQYNHYGVRPSAVAGYFSGYLANQPNVYELDVKIDADAERRFFSKNDIRRFEIGIDLHEMSEAHRAHGNSLTQVAELGEELGGAKLKLVISVGAARKETLAARTKDMIADFVRNTEGISHAEIAGRETQHDQIEVVDLLEQKLVFGDDVAVSPGRRVLPADRFKALRRAYGNWRHIL